MIRSLLLLLVLATPASAAFAEGEGSPGSEPGSEPRASEPASEPGSEPRSSDPPASGKSASETPEPPAEGPEEPAKYRNPRGSLVVGGAVGIAVGDGKTAVAIGLSVGYAVFTGVLPALRGVLIIDQKVGGEVAATLTLTPPLSLVLVPFAHGEVGRRWDGFGEAWLYGGGGGVMLGDPASKLGVELGWVFRRYAYEKVNVDGSGPLIAISLRF